MSEARGGRPDRSTRGIRVIEEKETTESYMDRVRKFFGRDSSDEGVENKNRERDEYMEDYNKKSMELYEDMADSRSRRAQKYAEEGTEALKSSKAEPVIEDERSAKPQYRPRRVHVSSNTKMFDSNGSYKGPQSEESKRMKEMQAEDTEKDYGPEL